jgi:tetratricopeptide (TPR) repeat protein
MQFVVAGFLVSLLSAQATPQPSFEGAWQSYRSGQFDRAVADLKVRTDPGIHEDADRWLKNRSVHDVEVALMLYSEVTFGLMDAALNRQTSTASPSLSSYTRHVRRLQQTVAEYERRTPFLRGFYLLWGAYLQSRNPRTVDPAIDFFNVAVQTFPDDPEILLMVGTWKELAWWGAPNNPQRDPNPIAEVGVPLLREARDYFRKAVATGAGTLEETHLRLGRMSIALGDYDAARSELERLQAIPGNTTLSYLANLFLGDVHERRGDLAAATAAYEAARRLVPLAQSAQLAVSHVAYRTGARKRAGEIVTEALSQPKLQIDPWWWYIRGQAWQFEPRLNAARRAVQR